MNRIVDVDAAARRPKPLLIYDGDCGFCRGWVARWRVNTSDRISYTPFQQVAEQFPGIPREQFARTAHLIDRRGDIHRGASAIFRAMAYGRRTWWPLLLYWCMPGFARLTELGYRLVANNRYELSGLVGWLSGSSETPRTHFLTRWLFVRLLGVIYMIAFLSLGVQILGLVGSHGMLPATDHLDQLRARFGDQATWRFPTLAWLGCSDVALQWACWGGAALSMLVVLRVAPGPILLLVWALYLSLYQVGQTFLSFQWDLLLLEAGFLAIFYASWHPWPRLRSEPPPSSVMRWLIIWLLFRLMFSSGVVKLWDESPQTPTWHELTALTYHYETQCIPGALAWYAHQLPLWIQKASVIAMFVIEIGVPFLFFLPRRARLLACLLQVLLQLVIIATGNYNFFNLLTIVLCVPLLDDGYLARILPRRLTRTTAPFALRRAPPLRGMVTVPVAALILLLSSVWMGYTLRPDRTKRRLDYSLLPVPLQEVVTVARRFSSVSSYGLFRNMTTRRPEIVIEGSNDRRAWLAYEFKWKPGDLNRRPTQVAPHQPRLDWQMWFAALGNYRSPRNRWFAMGLVRRLLEGSPEVLALLESNPFPDKPPRYIRSRLYDYHFTDWETRNETGAWWRREPLGLYSPVLSLDSFRGR